MTLIRSLVLAVVLVALPAFAERAPAFDKKAVFGTRYSLSGLSGKIVVLNFWFMSCPACRSEREELNRVVARYQSSGDVVFLAFSLDGARELKSFLQRNPLRYAVIADSHDVAKAYGVSAYPTHIIIDRNGEIADGWTGARDAFEHLTQAIDRLRARQKLPAPGQSASVVPRSEASAPQENLLFSPEQPRRGETVRIFYEPRVVTGRKPADILISWEAQVHDSLVQGFARMRQKGELVSYELKVPEGALRLRVRVYSADGSESVEHMLPLSEAWGSAREQP